MGGSIELQHKESGLTAFELAVALAIIAIMAAVTLPPYMQWRQKAQLSGAISNLATDLEMAKTQAIRANKTVVVDFGTNNYMLFLDTGNGSGGPPNWNQDSGEPVLLERDLPPGVRIDTGSLSFPTISDKTRFNSRGIPFDIVTPETILLVQGANNRQLTINRLGNIDIQ
ncbi:MAG: GspH/FimT family protein [Desulfobacterales bacterium]|jgi:Tfp pilus assembly protein FimT